MTGHFCSLLSQRVHCSCFRLNNALLDALASSIDKDNETCVKKTNKSALLGTRIFFKQTCVDKIWGASPSSGENWALSIDLFRQQMRLLE